MRKYISWEFITDAVGIYYQLAIDTERNDEYFVIFTMGSMVSVKDITNVSKHFCGYTPEIMENWPLWRLKGDNAPSPEEIYRDLQNVWTSQSQNCDNEINNVVKCAYKKLLENQLTDEIVPVICNIGDCNIVEFCDAANIVSSLLDDTNTEPSKSDDTLREYVDAAILLREYDLLFPQIYAIISPTHELIICVDESTDTYS